LAPGFAEGHRRWAQRTRSTAAWFASAEIEVGDEAARLAGAATLASSRADSVASRRRALSMRISPLRSSFTDLPAGPSRIARERFRAS
jgi:hypothetical protein